MAAPVRSRSAPGERGRIVVDRTAGEGRGLRFVGHQHVDAAGEQVEHIDGGGRVEHHRDAGAAGAGRGGGDGVGRHLELQQEHPAGGDGVGGGLDVRRAHGEVGPRNDDDGVVAARLHERHGDAGTLVGVRDDVAIVDPLVGQRSAEAAPEVVVAESTDDGDGGAGPAGGHGLVEPLAAEERVEPGAEHRLAPYRSAGRLDDEVEHEAGHDAHPIAHQLRVGAPFRR